MRIEKCKKNHLDYKQMLKESELELDITVLKQDLKDMTDQRNLFFQLLYRLVYSRPEIDCTK